MKNPTVRSNLKLIQEISANEAILAKALVKLIDLMMAEGTVQNMLVHRGKWKDIQKQLKEIARDD